jgi:hypothetical protein
MPDIIDLFVTLLGEPSSYEDLKKYLDFIDTAPSTNEEYTEIHHILPRSKFPHFEHEAWNKKKLAYSDHINAHKLLAEAYPIKAFVYPLNFMLPDEVKSNDDYKKILSERTKLWWKEFKETPKYQEWRKKRSDHMRTVMKQGRSYELSLKRYTNNDGRQKISDHFKRMWQSENYRRDWKASKAEYFNTPGVRDKLSTISKQKWKDMSPEKAKELKDNLRRLQRKYNASVSASNKVKWQDPVFRSKMCNRKPRGSDGSAMKARWADPEFRQKMLEARKNKGTKNETDKNC